jgi:membrane-associated phospholipid phosphatase
MSQVTNHSSPLPRWGLKWLAAWLTVMGVAFAVALAIDVPVTANRNAEAIPGDLNRIVELSEIFAHGFGAALALLLVWQLAPRLRHRMRPLAVCLIMPGLVVQGFKLMVARRRPLFYEVENLDSTERILALPDSAHETWSGLFPDWAIGSDYAYQSFPSAHAATAFAMAICLSWLFPQARVLFYVLAILAAFQRITSGAHWLSDVIAGAAVAFVVCYVTFRLERRRETRQRPSEADPALADAGPASRAAA